MTTDARASCPMHADFDPLSPAFLADPFAVQDALPRETPVFYAPSIDYYVVTRYADIEAVFLDEKTYSAAPAQLPLVQLVPEVTQILLANGLPLPKAGVIAELEGVRVAAAIAADLGVGDSPPPFDGTGACFIEMGAASAALVEGDWYAEPEPRVTIAEPDATHAAEKRAFESERLERWFAQ